MTPRAALRPRPTLEEAPMRPRPRPPALAVMLCAALAACGSPPAPAAGEPAAPAAHPPGIPVSRISLRRTSVFDTVAPASWSVPQTDPGRNEPIPRAHAEAPPEIPHGIAGMLPITRDENLCVDCHGDRSEDRFGPLMTPSHFTDLRNAPDVEREEVAASRWMCLACHLPVSDEPPLVPLVPPAAPQRGSR